MQKSGGIFKWKSIASETRSHFTRWDRISRYLFQHWKIFCASSVNALVVLQSRWKLQKSKAIKFLHRSYASIFFSTFFFRSKKIFLKNEKIVFRKFSKNQNFYIRAINIKNTPLYKNTPPYIKQFCSKGGVFLILIALIPPSFYLEISILWMEYFPVEFEAHIHGFWSTHGYSITTFSPSMST